MENHDINEVTDPNEIQIPVNLERYLQDNLNVFKFAGNVVNLYFTSFVKTGMEMISPASYDFERDEDDSDRQA